MTTGHDPSDDTNVSPPQEPAATPLVSAKQYPSQRRPVRSIDEDRLGPLIERADAIAESSGYEPQDCRTGFIGQDCAARWFGIEDGHNLRVIADGGDGGFDFWYRGARVDVKTVGRHRHDPALTVDAYEPLTADYYVLASRIGTSACRLVGYAPRQFVANAPMWYDDDGEPYRRVDQRYLFPIPRL